MRSFFRSVHAPFAAVLAGVLSFSLAGCGGGSNTPPTRPTLTVTAANASRVYGAANPTFTASATGALPADTFTFTASSVATPSSPGGAYPIVPVASGTNLANYNVVYVNGALTVDKAGLTVTPNNQSIASGSALPTLTATIAGFVNGDAPGVVTGLPTLTTTATSSSPAGSYPITASLGTLAAANYSFTFGNGTLTITPASNPGAGFTGKAMAGTQPIAHATVQVYAVGTTGNGSAGAALLTSPVTTDSSGAFTVPAGYACPAANSQLYIVIRGGGIGGAVNNSAIALATAIGPCNQIAASSQFVINEVTTAATAWGLAQFLSAGGNVGAASTNAQGLTNAVTSVANLVNITTGTAPGASFPKNGTSPAAKINSLANLLNTCTSTATSSECTPLFSATAPANPSNTLDAALAIVRNPGTNVAALYTQSTASTAFTPALTSAPADWTMFINYTGGGMNSPTGVGVDATGNVWVASYNSAASEFSPTGSPVFPNGITTGGLYESYGLAIDAQNNVWIPNLETPASVNGGFGSLTVLSSAGQVISGVTGYSAGGIAYPLAVAVDPNATVWVVNNYDASVTLLSSSGQPLSGANGYTSPQLAFSDAIAIDANHNAWVGNSEANPGTVTKISPTGQFTSYACCTWVSGIAIDQRGYVWATNYSTDSISLLASDGTVISSGYNDNKASISHPQGIAIDGSGHIWVTNWLGSSITELAGSAASSPGQILSPTAGWALDAKLAGGFAVAIDASGNLWVTNFNTNTLTQIVGLATPVKTPQLGPVQSP